MILGFRVSVVWRSGLRRLRERNDVNEPARRRAPLRLLQADSLCLAAEANEIHDNAKRTLETDFSLTDLLSSMLDVQAGHRFLAVVMSQISFIVGIILLLDNWESAQNDRTG